MTFRTVCSLAVVGILLPVSTGWSQVVQFRHQTTDLNGVPIDSVLVGEQFLLQTYTQHVGGYDLPEKAGVFAGYLDISYDPQLASVAGDIEHAPLYRNVVNGDLSVPGLLDNIGGVSSSGASGYGLDPIGPDEQLLFTLPMRADSEGELLFVGSESLEYPMYDVLVYATIVPVPARDIDFGEEDLRISFGRVTLNVQAVPEPSSCLLFALGVVMLTRFRRKSGR
jgi:hypothetical protein